MKTITFSGQPCRIVFDYRIAARRPGYETTRLAPVEIDNSRTQEVK